MGFFIWIGLHLAAQGSSATPIQLPAEAQPDPVITQAAEMTSRRIGRSSEIFTLRGVRADGHTLVVQAELHGMMEEMGAEVAVNAISQSICRKDSAFFREGRRLRLEVLSEGSVSSQTTVDSCSRSSDIMMHMSPSAYARLLRNQIGEPVGRRGDVFLRDARSDGNTLILTIDGGSGWRNAEIVQYVEDYILRDFCRRARQMPYFYAGRLLRVDTIAPGESLAEGRIFEQCPARGSGAR